MKKIAGFILAAVLLLCLSSAVFAANETGARTDLTFTYGVPAPSYIIDMPGTWKKGTTTGITIKCDGNLDKFTDFKIGGVSLGADVLADTPGGTVITLAPEFLETLALGDHTVEFIFTDGSVQTTLTILPADPPGGNGGGNPYVPPIDSGTTGPDTTEKPADETTEPATEPETEFSTEEEPTENPTEEATITEESATEVEIEKTTESQTEPKSESETAAGTTAADKTPGGPTVPENNDPDVPPAANTPGNIVKPDTDGGGKYIEYDADGYAIGEWTWDEDEEMWVFDEYPVPLAPGDIGYPGENQPESGGGTQSEPDGGKPPPGTGDSGVIMLWVMLRELWMHNLGGVVLGIRKKQKA